MNIFVSDADPNVAAANLDDKRVVKMILESAQILCTAVHEHGGLRKIESTGLSGKSKIKYFFDVDGAKAYKPTHVNHPVSLWARENRSNYLWLLTHMKALSDEYIRIYGRVHKSYLSMFKSLEDSKYCVPDGQLSDFTNCAAREDLGIDYRDEHDTVTAYRKYLRDRWLADKKKPKWTSRNKPNWLYINSIVQ